MLVHHLMGMKPFPQRAHRVFRPSFGRLTREGKEEQITHKIVSEHIDRSNSAN